MTRVSQQMHPFQLSRAHTHLLSLSLSLSPSLYFSPSFITSFLSILYIYHCFLFFIYFLFFIFYGSQWPPTVPGCFCDPIVAVHLIDHNVLKIFILLALTPQIPQRSLCNVRSAGPSVELTSHRALFLSSDVGDGMMSIRSLI